HYVTRSRGRDGRHSLLEARRQRQQSAAALEQVMLRAPAQRLIDPLTPANTGLIRLVNVIQAMKVQNDFAWITTLAQPAAPNPFQMDNVIAASQLGLKIAAKLRMNHV